jgi:hypothetical protein
MRRPAVFFAMLLLLCLHQGSLAQRHFSHLTGLGELLERRVRDEKPEWECRVIQPASVDEAASNDQVTIRQWASERRIVRVAIIRHQSDKEAVTALRQFTMDKKANSRIQGLGNEAFVWGLRGSIAFRQGNLTVYVTAVVSKDADPVKMAKNPDETRHLTAQAERAEEALVTKGFVQHVAAVLATF